MGKTFVTPLWAVLISLCLSCAYYNTLFNAKKNFNEGIRVLRENPNARVLPSKARKYFDTTIEKCWKLIEIYSEKSKYADDALLYIIKSEYYLNHLAQAQIHADQFLKKYPNSDLVPEVLLWYGKIYLKQNRYDQARERFIQAINATRKAFIRAEANFALGQFSFDKGDYEIAIDYFKKAMAEGPDEEYRARLEFMLGESYFKQKNFQEAIKHYQRVKKFDPAVDIEYKSSLHMAQAYVRLGNLERGINILKKLLTAPRFEPYASVLKTELGRIYEMQKDYLTAEQLYREALYTRRRGRVPGMAQASFRLANLFEHVYHNLDSAVTYYAQVKGLDPEFDSLKIAESKRMYLKELKDLQHAIQRDARLVYRLKHDRYFRDSLYNAQRQDSLLAALGYTNLDSAAQRTLDFMRQWISADSLKKMQQDSLLKAKLDSIEQARRDSLAKLDAFADLRNRTSPLGKEREGPGPAGRSRRGKKRNQRGKNKPRKETRKLAQIQQDLMENRFHLAEFYLLKDQNFDSAAYHYRQFIQTYQDSVLTPKALYSLLYIYRLPEFQDSARADSLEQLILKRYPTSVFAREILRQKQQASQKNVRNWLEERAHKLFLKAESLYFARQVDSALVLYRQVADLDTSLEWSAKAMFALAWIYEKDVHKPEKALAAYKALLNRYTVDGPYKEIARRKTTPVTLAEANRPSASTARHAMPVERGERHSEEPAVSEKKGSAIPLSKIRWRRRRMLQHRGTTDFNDFPTGGE